MNDNNYPWPMDKPIEEIEDTLIVVCGVMPPRWELVDYLIKRLKIAEAERDEYKERWLYDERNETF